MTFDKKGKYERATVEVFKAAIEALPINGPLEQIILFENLDANYHGVYELYHWLADRREEKGFAVSWLPSSSTTPDAVAGMRKYASKCSEMRVKDPEGVELWFEIDDENILLLSEGDLPIDKKMLRALGISPKTTAVLV